MLQVKEFNHVPKPLLLLLSLTPLLIYVLEELCPEERWLSQDRIFLGFSAIKNISLGGYSSFINDRSSLNIFKILQEVEKQNEQDRL